METGFGWEEQLLLDLKNNGGCNVSSDATVEDFVQKRNEALLDILTRNNISYATDETKQDLAIALCEQHIQERIKSSIEKNDEYYSDYADNFILQLLKVKNIGDLDLKKMIRKPNEISLDAKYEKILLLYRFGHFLNLPYADFIKNVAEIHKESHQFMDFSKTLNECQKHVPPTSQYDITFRDVGC